MIENMFREIRDDKDITDIVAKIFVFMAVSSAIFMMAVGLWKIFRMTGNA